MGCDVHVIVEVKTESGWLGVYASDARVPSEGIPDVKWRDYELFGRLAGVRRDGPEPKGWPEDASPLAVYILSQNEDDYHSLTWYPLAEAVDIYNAAPSAVGSKKSGHFAPWDFTYDADSKDVDDFRVLFAFDN